MFEGLPGFQIDENDPLWHWRTGVQIPVTRCTRFDELRPWLEKLAGLLGDIWVDEVHTPQSRDLLRMAAAAPLDYNAPLSDAVLHRVRRTFGSSGQQGKLFQIRVKYVHHKCGGALSSPVATPAR